MLSVKFVKATQFAMEAQEQRRSQDFGEKVNSQTIIFLARTALHVLEGT